MKNIYVVIPTLNPDTDIMLSFIKKLKKEFSNILVVNDGSDVSFDKFFASLESDGVEVLTHYKNLGKGRSLKDAFNYLLNRDKNIEGIVQTDCDGQHSVKDILNVALEVVKNPDKLILGVRDFNEDIVPFKSRYGNIITRNVFSLFVGMNITDTQTGLRGLSRELMITFLDTVGERYEYETNMLIMCHKYNINIKEITIDTIYLNNNENSHFNPIKDSISVYKLFGKYFLLSFLFFILDILLFIFLYNLANNIVLSTLLSRAVITMFSYCYKRETTLKFKSVKYLIKYFILEVLSLLLNILLVSYLFNLFSWSVILIKIVVNLVISIIILYLRKIGLKNEK